MGSFQVERRGGGDLLQVNNKHKQMYAWSNGYCFNRLHVQNLVVVRIVEITEGLTLFSILMVACYPLSFRLSYSN